LKDFIIKCKECNITDYKLYLYIIYRLGTSLAYLHSKNIIHRNLKPENIFIDFHNNNASQINELFSINNIRRVVIGDLMFSRELSYPEREYTPEDPKERDRSGREARRLWYKPPEFILRKTMYSNEIDVWAFGCLMYEIVNGDTLFMGECEIDQIFKI